MGLKLLLVVPMLVAVLVVGVVALALSACGGGEEKSASGGTAPTNGQIAFRRYLDPDQTKGAIFTMNPDGSHIRQIMHPPEGWRDNVSVWSPDGERIAFDRQRIDESMSRIMVVDPET